MVAGGVRLTVEDPGDHGALLHGGAEQRVINGVVDQGGSVVPAGKAAEGQVIVPGNQGEVTVALVEVVVVEHGAGVAVPIEDEVVDHKVADDLVHVQGAVQICPAGQGFQGLNQSVLLGGGQVKSGCVEDVPIAGDVVVRVLELQGIGTAALASGRLKVRLVNLSAVCAIAALGEGLLYALHGQVQPLLLPVDGDGEEGAQRGLHPHGGHHFVAQIVLHTGVVLNQVVQGQFVQPLIGFACFIVVEFEL